jgi:hypothetical protein
MKNVFLNQKISMPETNIYGPNGEIFITTDMFVYRDAAYAVIALPGILSIVEDLKTIPNPLDYVQIQYQLNIVEVIFADGNGEKYDFYNDLDIAYRPIRNTKSEFEESLEYKVWEYYLSHCPLFLL